MDERERLVDQNDMADELSYMMATGSGTVRLEER